MRLRALHLGNARKFAGKRASITGIGDGITVVSEANEFGKSTFFDAIHALFFEKYSATAKAVKSLRPYAGGAVEVSAEVETDDGLFRIEKRFLSRASARVMRLPGEGLIAQDDEAESWITELLGTETTGPAGLLWVRQGQLGLEASGKEEEKNTETRRDLLSSVSGEIDAMTGGRRMDRVMRRVAEDLSEVTTKTGRKTGAWKAVGDEIAAVEAELSGLDAQIDQLSLALAGRKQAEGQLALLEQPAAKVARDASLAAAQATFAQAEAHAGRVDMAVRDHKLADIQAATDRMRLDTFLAAIATLDTATADAESTAESATSSTVLRAQTEVALNASQAIRSQTADAVVCARTALEAARKQTEARAAQARANDLNDQLQQIEIAHKTRDEKRAKIDVNRATSSWLRQVEEAQDVVSQHSARLAAQAATVTMTYSGDARVSTADEGLPNAEPVALTGVTDLTLPGIGTMLIRLPQTGQGARAALANHRKTLNDLLEMAGAKSVADARTIAAKRVQAAQERDVADAVLKTLAPNGADVLRAAKAAADLAAQAANDDALPGQSTLDEGLAKAEAEDVAAQSAQSTAEADHTAAREAAIRAQAAAQTAHQTLDRATAAAGAPDAREAMRADLIRADATAGEALTAKANALAVLRADAPDLATAQAELTRAKAAVEAAVKQHQTLSVRVAALSAEIRAYAQNGVEEARDGLAERLDAARAEEARFAVKAAALTRLQSALEAERSAARDTYFGPVQEQLKPLLAILYDDAGLQFDSESLLPAGLTRAQTEERLDDLSGGTQEQIAILTRLAFARLFQEQGRHMPIVLDDALVYSDDGRIIKMFTALNRVAQGQQILVFTCRTMAFLTLGGTRPEVTVDDL